MSKFELWFDNLMEDEGGYVNDPQDPGGETKWGVSKRSYPHLDIANLTREDAKGIAKSDYWDKFGYAPESTLRCMLADTAYNAGLDRAEKLLQHTLGVEADGQFGPLSQAALTERFTAQGDLALAAQFAAHRLMFYTDLGTWTRYGKGWTRRVAKGLLFYMRNA